MLIQRIETSNGIDDIKIIGETDAEKLFIKQLAEAGTLYTKNRTAADTVTFRAISVSSDFGSSSYTSDTSLGTYNFTLIQNQNFLRDLKIIKSSAPLDLTTFSNIKLAVKNRKHGAVIFEVSVGSGLTITGDDNNFLGVSFSSANTQLLCNDEYYYDILFIKPTSNTYYLEGKIKVKHTGTR